MRHADAEEAQEEQRPDRAAAPGGSAHHLNLTMMQTRPLPALLHSAPPTPRFHSLTEKLYVRFLEEGLPVCQVCWAAVTSLYTPSSNKPKSYFQHFFCSDNHAHLFAVTFMDISLCSPALLHPVLHLQ